MGVALLSAHRSKDPVTQVWACIVNLQKRIVGIGYNWFPLWCNDDDFPWGKHQNMLEDKRTYVVHAEANAILNTNKNLDNCVLYVKLFPCNECAKLIIQSGIKKVIYLIDEDQHKDLNKAAKKMFESAGVEIQAFVPKSKEIVLEF